MKNQVQNSNQITEGVIWKQLLLFFFPILFGTFFQQLYNTVDTIIVGHFVGKEALACVGGSTSQILNLLVGFFVGLSSGATVIIAQFFGADDERSVRESLHTAYAFSILGSIVVGIVGFIFSPSMLRMMNTPAELIADSTIYLRVYFSGVLFVLIYNIGSGVLRAIGDSKHPLYYLIWCCIINIVLDVVFVVAFNLGVFGVAVATMISQAISALLVTRKLMKSTGILQLIIREIRIHPFVLKSQLQVGIPAGIQSVMYSITNVLIQAALNTFGTDTVAAWSIYGKLDAIFWMITGAFGISITTFVGQNYGARKNDRVRKSTKICLAMNISVSFCLVLVLIFFKEIFFKIFITDTAVVKIASDMLMFIAPWTIVYVFIEILSGSLRGMGDVIVPTIITLLGTCIFRIIWISVSLKIHAGLNTVLFSYPVTWVSTAALFIIYYLFHTRKLRQ